MAITITINGTVTMDETSGLQVGVATATEDNNDSDVLLSTLPTTFSNRLFLSSGSGGLGLSNLFGTADGVAKSADNYITVSGTGTVVSLNFTTSAGAALPVYSVGVDPATGAASGLSAVSGGAITMFSDLSGRIALGVDTTGNIVFALFMDPAANLLSAKVWMVQFEALANTNSSNFDDPLALTGLGVGAGASQEFNFDSLPSGSNLFGIVGDASAGLVVFGHDIGLKADNTFISNQTQEVKTSQAGLHATIGIESQMFDPGDAAYFTFVKNPDLNFTGFGLDSNEADDADNILYGSTLETSSAFLRVAQLQSGGAPTMSIQLFNIAGSPQGVNMINARGVNAAGKDPDITAVRVYAPDGTTLLESFANGVEAGLSNSITISINASGVATISGFQSNNKIEWDADEAFDQALVTGVAGKFDIGGFGANEATSVSAPLSGVRFEDDGPSVDLVLNGTAELRLDETDNDADDGAVGGILAQNSLTAAQYLTTNSAIFGTDGQAGANPTVWSLSLTGANVNGVDSGLDDALTDNNVMLFLVNSTTIEGRSGSAAGPIVLTITINATTGQLSVVQNRAVEHNDPNDNDEAGLSSAMMNSGLVGAVRTVTDGDGDSANDSVDVSQVIKLEDDGPDVDINLNPLAELRLDETDNDADDNNVGGILATKSLTAANYLNINTAVFGSDGAAGANPSVWSLGLTGANVNGVDSGLNDAVTDTDVLLFVVNSTTIVGKAGSAAGPTVLTISINSTTGELTVTQDRAVEHNDPNDNDEAGLSSAMMNAGLVSATRTITDGDGDHDADSVDVSQVIKLEDDGPDVDINLNPLAELRLDETDNDADDGAVGGILAQNSLAASSYLNINTAVFGSDGAAGANPTVWSLGLTGANVNGVDSNLDDTLSGQDVLLFVVNSTTIVGKAGGAGGPTVMTVTINASTGELTVVQNRAVEHDDSADPDEANSPAMMSAGLISATRTITDGDGDHDSDSVDVSHVIKLEDDGPSVDIELNGSAEVTVDESTLPASDSITVANLFSTNTAVFGSDGPAADDTIYKLLLSDDNSGLLDTATGDEVLLSINAAGTLITGKVNDGGDVTVLTIAVDPDTGEVTLTQLRALVNGDPTDPDESDTPLTLPNGLVGIERTITDGDGDHDSDNVDISQIFKFEDDGPALGPPSQDDINLITDDTAIADFDTLSTDVVFPNAPDFGSDGPNATDSLDFELRLATDNGNSGLIDTATGRAILLKTVGNDIVGYVDADGSGSIGVGETTEAIRYSLTFVDVDTDSVTFTQTRSVVHANVNDPDEAGAPETINPNLVFVDQTAIDGDGDVSDVVSFDLGAITFLLDDGPDIGPIANSIVDFAAGATSGTKTLNGDVNNDPKTNPYTLTAFTSSLVINGVTLHGVAAANNQSVTYWANTNGNGVFGDAGDTAYYQLNLNESGAGTYKFDVLVNPPPANLEFNFDDLPSGANLFGIVGDAAAGMIIFGRDIGLKADHTFISNQTQEVKTSQAGLHATIGIESQMFDPGDAAYFTFVHTPDPNFTGSALNSNEADDADNLLYGSTLESDSAFLRIAQLQSGGVPTMSIQLFNIDGSPQGVNMINARGVNAAGKDPDVTEVKVYAADGTTLLESFSGGVEAHLSNSITISINASGVATVSGFQSNYKIEWKADEVFDQALVTGVAGKFDIGGVGLNQAQPTPDQVLDFTAQVIDGDGDTDTASWKIGIDGTGVFDDNLVSGVII